MSNEVKDKSGMLEDKLISELLREPITESSLADGCDEASDEEAVDEFDADWECACLWLPMAPCEADAVAEPAEALRSVGVD